MKIIWSEKGLRVLRTIFTVIIAIASIGILTAFLMIMGGIGSFDYGPMTKPEETKTMFRIAMGVIIAAVCVLAAIFGNKINDAINAELRRRYKLSQIKRANAPKADAAEMTAVQRDNREEYRALLAKYADDDIRDGENQ